RAAPEREVLAANPPRAGEPAQALLAVELVDGVPERLASVRDHVCLVLRQLALRAFLFLATHPLLGYPREGLCHLALRVRRLVFPPHAALERGGRILQVPEPRHAQDAAQVARVRVCAKERNESLEHERVPVLGLAVLRAPVRLVAAL